MKRIDLSYRITPEPAPDYESAPRPRPPGIESYFAMAMRWRLNAMDLAEGPLRELGRSIRRDDEEVERINRDR